MRPYSQISRCKTQRALSSVMASRPQLMYRPHTQICRREPVRSALNQNEALELDRLFSEVNLFCAECIEKTIHYKREIIQRESKLNEEEAAIQEIEDQLTLNEDKALRALASYNANGSSSSLKVHNYEEELRKKLQELFWQIEQENDELEVQMEFRNTITIMTPREFISMRDQAQPIRINHYENCTSTEDILTNAEVLEFARQILFSPDYEVHYSHENEPYKLLFTKNYVPVKPDVINSRRLQKYYAKLYKYELPCCYSKFYEEDEVFLTEAHMSNEPPFESIVISNSNTVDPIILKSIELLKASFHYPEIALSVSDCVTEHNRLSDKFRVLDQVNQESSNKMRLQLAGMEEDAMEEQSIKYLRREINDYTLKIEKVELELEEYGEYEQERLEYHNLNMLYEKVSQNLQNFARNINIYSPIGSNDLIEKLVEKIELKIDELINQYLQFDKAKRRKSRMKWIEQKKRFEIKEEEIKNQYDNKEKQEEQSRISHKVLMARSFNAPKKLTEFEHEQEKIYADYQMKNQQDLLFYD